MKNKKNKKKNLSTVFRRKLLKVSAIILVCSFILIFIAVIVVVRMSTAQMLKSQIREHSAEVNDRAKTIFESPNIYMEDPPAQIDKEMLQDNMGIFLSTNWYYINKGIVKFTDDSSMLNKKASSDPELSRFSDILSGKEKTFTSAQSISSEDFKSKNWYKYSICKYNSDSFVVLKYAPSEYYHMLDEMVEKTCDFESVGANGTNALIRQDGKIVSPTADVRAERNYYSNTVDIDWLISLSGENELFRFEMNDTPYYAMYAQADGYYVISLIPRKDVIASLNYVMMITGFLVLLLLAIIFLRINHLMKKLVVKNIKTINSELSEITSGNLDTRIDVRDNLEFDQLSDGINSTVDTLKGYIARESERFEQELELARSIQVSALPNVFPPFPDRHDIDIFASMKPAKQVGGDFYDFFFTDDVHLVFLIADVSDKGVPAAMFMMKAKTIIKSLAQSNIDIEDVITTANNVLCEDNSADMFVTLWIGALNTETGELSYINAGHCKPLHKRSDGEFEYLSERPDFVVAGEEDVPYHCRTLTLKKGDALFLYTDGVTEAVNSEDTLYGEERLKETLSRAESKTAESICACVSGDISDYSKNAPQTDDITMLAVMYNGSRIFEEMTIDADFSQLEDLYSFIKRQLKSCGFDNKAVAQFSIIADEICANIVRYAYPDKKGKLTASVTFDPASNEAALTFTDNGIPFNPLNAPEPDVENAEDREEGGLGIFLVRKFSDRLQYEYTDDKNILTIIKKREQS